MKLKRAVRSILLLVFLMASACGSPTAGTGDVPAVDVTGNYNVAGTNPDGSGYGCMLDIAAKGNGVYEWFWFACGDYEGIGVQQGNVVSVAWGASDCSVVAYKIQSDGMLNAKWTPMQYTTLGTEIAKPNHKDGKLEGTYKVTGTNPDGSTYDGTLEVTKTGDTYRWLWNAGGEFTGVGIQREDVVSVAYGAEGCSVLSYVIHEDKTLDSLWAYVGQSDLGTEAVTPLDSDAASSKPEKPVLGEVGQFTSNVPARPSQGCGKESKYFPGATSNVSINVNGLDRIYLLHLPTNYDPNKPTSLVLNIHGYTDTAGGMESGTDMSRHADEYNYIVVYPNATNFKSDGRVITSWNDLTCNASPGPEGPICSEDADKYPFPTDCSADISTDCNWCTCNDDLGYINQMLDELEANYCVDLNRVYATGMSNGGMFTHRLGCDLANRFAAIAPVSGTLARGFNCAPESTDQISIMNIHGRQDDYVDVTGKESSDGYFYTNIDDVMSLWAGDQSQSCDSEVTVYTTIADGVNGMSCTQHADCETGAEVVSCWWDAGHDWPTYGSDLIWDFFIKNPKNIQP